MRRLVICAALSLAVAGMSAPATAAIHIFSTPLSPEVPGATGSGLVTVTFDTTLDTLEITASWSGLTGVTTVAHIHCCVAPPGFVGVAVTPGTLPGFPTGVDAGSYAVVLDLDDPATYTTAFRNANGFTPSGAAAGLLAGIQRGEAYFNIHSDRFRGGEIRGFLAPVPEPGAWAMLIAGFGAIGSVMRRRTASASERRQARPAPAG